jgi:hypothetical protein
MNASNQREKTAPPVERLTYTTQETCQVLGVSVSSLWRLHRRKILMPLTGLRKKRYAIAAVERFLAGNKAAP